MITLNGTEIKPTIFPDRTSQVWKLGNELPFASACEVVWEFENEAELSHLIQLKFLLDQNHNASSLYMPYLPYARQDKEIGNTSTFALIPFLRVLRWLNFCQYKAFDVHNPAPCFDILRDFVNLQPITEVNFAFTDSGADCILYPDAGAYERYGQLFKHHLSFSCKKDRNQSTGTIVSVTMNTLTANAIKGKRVLIGDDLCDGGATFVQIATMLRNIDCESSLYVSHGIFSKGTQVLRDAGIRNIYTRKGKVN